MRVVISIVALFFILPGVIGRCLQAWWRGEKIGMYSRDVLGKGMVKLTMRRIMIANKPMLDFDKWFHYLKGNIDLVGPKAISADSLSTLNEKHHKRFKVCPGIFSPYQVKKAAGIAYESEPEIAVDFVKEDSALRRLSLLFSLVVRGLIGANKKTLFMPDQFTLFGVNIDNVSMREALDKIMSSLKRPVQTKLQQPTTFAFVNADCANKYYENEQYQKTLNTFSAVFADGIGVKIAAQLSGQRLKENVNGTDMFPRLCKHLDASQKRIFLLGAKATVIEKVAKKLAKEYPGIVIADYVDGYSYNDNQTALRKRINQAKADILFVAMGAPRQEDWIRANKSCLNVSTMIGVGGLFDFYSETVARAPEWIRELSMEWVWRLAVQPLDKGRRYLIGNPLFLTRALINRSTKKPQTTEQEVP